MAYNYYHAYGNAYKKGEGIKSHTTRLCQNRALDPGIITDKQKQFHAALFAFLLEKGLARTGDIFDRPRSKKDCRKKIGAMMTVLEKNGLSDEFFNREEREP